MDRQLKQTAFFGTDGLAPGCRRDRRPLQRHYEAGGPQPPSPDVGGRYVVGRASEPAADAPEVVARRPVPLVRQAAAGALPAGVPGVDEDHRDTLQRRLVDQELAKLGEPP